MQESEENCQIQNDNELAEMIYLQDLCHAEDAFVNECAVSFVDTQFIGSTNSFDSHGDCQMNTGFQLPNTDKSNCTWNAWIPQNKEKIKHVPKKSRFRQLKKTKTEKAKQKAHIKYLNWKNQEIRNKNEKRTRIVKKAVKTGNITDLKSYFQSYPDEKNDIIDNIGLTAMGYACIRGNFEVVEFLLHAGADPHQIGMTGSALDIAVRQNNHEIISLLTAFGCECDDKEKLMNYFQTKRNQCAKSARKTIENEPKRE